MDRLKFRFGALVVLAVVAVIGLLASSIVIVDESEFAIVTDFGRPARVYGVGQVGSGPHWKAPWQGVIRVDRRLQFFDPPAREMLTGDKKNLDVSSYVVWRVADPSVFLRAAGSTEVAETLLNERVTATLSDALGRRQLSTLISIDARSWRLDELTTEVLHALAPPARDEFGIELVDVRVRRFNHPTEVRPAIFDLIRAERRQVASRLRAEGEAQFQQLSSEAERERAAILARADAEAERIKGKADAEATRIANQAQSKDPRFAEFLRTLDAYRTLLDDRTTLVLSAASPLLRILAEGPPPEVARESSTPTAPARASSGGSR